MRSAQPQVRDNAGMVGGPQQRRGPVTRRCADDTGVHDPEWASKLDEVDPPAYGADLVPQIFGLTKSEPRLLGPRELEGFAEAGVTEKLVAGKARIGLDIGRRIARAARRASVISLKVVQRANHIDGSTTASPYDLSTQVELL